MSKVNPSKKRMLLPTIEVPRLGDAQSVSNSIAQIKEAIEIMSGVRGGKAYFPTYDDATLVQERLKSLESNSHWQTIYDQKFNITPSGFVTIPNLSEYRMLRVAGYVATGTAQAVKLQLSSGGVFIGALEYLNDYIYQESGTATLVTTSLSAGAIELSLNSVVASGNPYGCRFDITIKEFNQPATHTTAQGFLDWYTGANLRAGVYHLRPGASALNNAMDGIRLFTGSAGFAYSGHMLVEGLKG